MTWYSDEAVKQALYEQSAQMAKAAGWKIGDNDGIRIVQRYTRTTGKRFDAFADMAHFLGCIKDWLTANAGMPERVGMGEGFYIEATVARSWGNTEIKLTAGAWYDVTSGSERTAAYDRLVQALFTEHKNIVQQHSNAVADGGGGGGDIVDDTIVSVVHTVDENGHRYKIKTGRFSKWGVPVYPEVLQATYGNDYQNTLPLGDTEQSGKVKILMNGGKPKKIISIDG